MLKIKDEVDLKELEKFGFRKRYCHYVKDCEGTDQKSRRLCVVGGKTYKDSKSWHMIYGIYYYSNDEMLHTLFDLIQAGLVEKVEENCGGD